ncbi:MAG: hypothetical protein GY913_03390 [Proteobacteria bacterium]|nr:hypothetical protein [Pseudomonadota bacterium]MCP4915944.1 hypothetical protein [Pseudomonadota bacterium]
MSLPADFWNLPAFTGLVVADRTALETSATETTFTAHQTLATDHNDVAVLLTGRAILSRDGVVERVVEAPAVLDLTEPAIGAHPSFFTLEPGLVVFLPRAKVEAVVGWVTLRESAMEQSRDERTDLSELVDHHDAGGEPGGSWRERPSGCIRAGHRASRCCRPASTTGRPGCGSPSSRAASSGTTSPRAGPTT